MLARRCGALLCALLLAAQAHAQAFKAAIAAPAWGSRSNALPPAQAVRRRGVHALYATGRRWVDAADLGIKHCVVQGTLSLHAMTMDLSLIHI